MIASDSAAVAQDEGEGGVYLEFQTVGHIVKVSAIDPASGTEVSTFGPVGAARADLETLALAKLRRRLDMAAAAKAERAAPPVRDTNRFGGRKLSF